MENPRSFLPAVSDSDCQWLTSRRNLVHQLFVGNSKLRRGAAITKPYQRVGTQCQWFGLWSRELLGPGVKSMKTSPPCGLKKNLAASRADGLRRQARPKLDDLSAKRLGNQFGVRLGQDSASLAKWPYRALGVGGRIKVRGVTGGPGTCTWRAPNHSRYANFWWIDNAARRTKDFKSKI